MRVRILGDAKYSRPTFTGRIVSLAEAQKAGAAVHEGDWVYVDPDPGDHGKQLQGWRARIVIPLNNNVICAECGQDANKDDYLCGACRGS